MSAATPGRPAATPRATTTGTFDDGLLTVASGTASPARPSSRPRVWAGTNGSWSGLTAATWTPTRSPASPGSRQGRRADELGVRQPRRAAQPSGISDLIVDLHMQCCERGVPGRLSRNDLGRLVCVPGRTVSMGEPLGWRAVLPGDRRKAPQEQPTGSPTVPLCGSESGRNVLIDNRNVAPYK